MGSDSHPSADHGGTHAGTDPSSAVARSHEMQRLHILVGRPLYGSPDFLSNFQAKLSSHFRSDTVSDAAAYAR